MRLALLALLVALLAVGLLLTVSGCGGNEDDGESLKGTEWTLVSGVAAPPDAVPTVTFDGEVATGLAVCAWAVGFGLFKPDSGAVRQSMRQ